MTISYYAILILFPLCIHYLEPKIKIIKILSPVVICYTTGLILGNYFDLESTATQLSEISVPLAIPLLLLSINLKEWFKLAPKTVLSFCLIIFSVVIITVLSSFIFKSLTPFYWQVAGMLVGVYTGGTPNMSAIGLALGVDQEIFILLNAADLILGAFYLLFILTIGVKLIGKLLPSFSNSHKLEEQINLSLWNQLTKGEKYKNVTILLIVSITILASSVGLSHFIFQSLNVPFLILMITTSGLALSSIVSLRTMPGSYEVGQYLLLIFCIAIGSLANIEKLSTGSLIYLSYCAIVMFFAILLHLGLAKIFKIDRDTAIITSVAGIFGPAFIGPVASVLKNRVIVVSGLTSGLMGYAIGNYIGLAVAYLVKSLV